MLATPGRAPQGKQAARVALPSRGIAEDHRMATIRSAIASKSLDPASSLSEVLFGLIMTLTFTLGAGLTLQEEGREGARQLLIATIGCNIAWGVIDGVLYIVGRLFERGRRKRLAQSIRRRKTTRRRSRWWPASTTTCWAGNEHRRAAGPLPARGPPGARGDDPAEPDDRADAMGAIASFWLVFLASLPAAIPFLFIDDARRALRVSNLLLLALLFAAGYAWGRHAVARPWLAGLVFLLGGSALVVATIALGG